MINRLSPLLGLSLSSLLTGMLIGVVGAGFRFCLERAEAIRTEILQWAHQWPQVGWLIPVFGAAACAGLARYLVVRFSPIAAGSGVQRVEAVIRGEAEPATWRVIPVKFVGGVLAIGSGGALGREGPTVQMGAALGTFWARLFLRNAPDQSVINAAGAGAGLAVAFNAPIGASVFVIEELTRRVTPRLLIATLAASAIAVAEMRALLGNAPDFLVARGAVTPVASLPYYLIAGVLLGVLGAAYNATIVRFLDLFQWLQRLPAVVPAAMVGLVVGLLAWFAPSFVGGGDFLSQTIIWNGLGLSSLATVLVVRFFLGPLSYAPGMPGGLFAPLLLVGAAASALLAGSVNAIWPATLPTTDFAVVGMAAFFTAVVRTPFTGIMLVAEMTERADLALPLLVASLGAILISTALGSEPIYDTLRARMPANDRLKHEAKLS